MSNDVIREERRRFNCHKYKVLTYITYGYNESGDLIFASCSLESAKHCNGYESPERLCPYRFPHSLKEQ